MPDGLLRLEVEMAQNLVASICTVICLKCLRLGPGAAILARGGSLPSGMRPVWRETGRLPPSRRRIHVPSGRGLVASMEKHLGGQGLASSEHVISSTRR